MHKSWKNGSNGENKDDKRIQKAVSTFFFLANDLGKKFPIPLPLAGTAGVQLHHTQKYYPRSGH